MTINDNAWLMFDYVLQYTNKYDYIWLCLSMNNVKLSMTMYDNVRPNMTIYNNVRPCMTMYDYVWLWLTTYNYTWLHVTISDCLRVCMTKYASWWLPNRGIAIGSPYGNVYVSFHLPLHFSVWLCITMYDYV